MDYQETLSYIRKISEYGSVLGLDSIKRLIGELSGNAKPAVESGRIQTALCDRIPSIQIAGTNGKGSTGAFLAGILRQCGCKVGHFSSPSVIDYEEMFRINGENIPKERLAVLYTTIEAACERIVQNGFPHPTLFEVETAAAFLYFYEEGCDVEIIEAGMGGATDATNVITHPIAAILTPISMDHTRFLGDTLAEIAKVKSGIIKPGCIVISAPQEDEAMNEIAAAAKRANAQILQTVDCKGLSFDLRMPGTFQAINAAVAIETAQQLSDSGAIKLPVPLSEETISAGVRDVSLPGRFERMGTLPGGAAFYRDGGHNPGAAKCLVEALQTYFTNRRIIYIMGVFSDKDYRKVLEIMRPCSDMVFALTPDHKRALDKEVLCAAAREAGYEAIACESVQDAIAKADSIAKAGDIVLAFGSFSYLKEIQL